MSCPFSIMNLSRQEGPVYLTLAATLRAELSIYQAGDLLPGELPLARRFGVNRHTIRRALDILAQEGSVIRIKGKGTQVLNRPMLYPVRADSAYSESFSAMGYSSEARLLKVYQRIANADEVKHLQLKEDENVLEYKTLRLIEDQPVSLISHFFSQQYAFLLKDYAKGSMRAYLQQRGCELVRVFSLIGARMPTVDEASRLLIPHQQPVLTVQTLSRDQHGRPMELSFSVSRADHFQYQVFINGVNEHDSSSKHNLASAMDAGTGQGR